MGEGNNQQPKCLRIVVTSFFADGSSSVIDIPEPLDVKDESHVIVPASLPEYEIQYGLQPSKYQFVLKATVNPNVPARVMPLPIRERT